MPRIAAVLGICLVQASAANAWATTYGLRLSSSRCGTELDMRQRVDRRLLRPSASGWSFVVEIESVGDSLSAYVTSASPTGTVEKRKVEGSQCDSVLDAAALVVAVTLDPTLLGTPPGSETPSQRLVSSSPPPSAAPRRFSWDVGLVGSVGGRTSIADTVALELTLGSVLRLKGTFQSEVSLRYVLGRGDISSPGLPADLLLNAARGCVVPVRLAIVESLHLLPAAGLEVGYLRGTAEVDNARPAGGLWFSSLFELGVALDARGFTVGAVPFAGLSLKPDRFRAENSEIHSVPRWEFGGRLDAAVWLF